MQQKERETRSGFYLVRKVSFIHIKTYQFYCIFFFFPEETRPSGQITYKKQKVTKHPLKHARSSGKESSKTCNSLSDLDRLALSSDSA